jgi:hypothetical protein
MQINEVNVIQREEGTFVLDKKFEDILQFIQLEMPVIIRKLFSEDEVKHLRNCCTEIAKKEKANHPKDRSFGCKNYHSIYNNNPKSNVKSILHAFTFFPWNKESKKVIPYFDRLIKLRNTLTGLPEDYALKNEVDGRVSVPTVQQYPRGGGYMQEHRDPDVGQKAIVSVALSDFSNDFESGGVFFRNKEGEKIYVDPIVKSGDALIFPPKVEHGVDPIDPKVELDWGKEDGRWMCMAALLSIKSMNGLDDKAAGQPVQDN